VRAIKTGLVAAAGVLLMSGCHGGSRPSTGTVAATTPSVAASAAPGPAVLPVSKKLDGTFYYSDSENFYAVHATKKQTLLHGIQDRATVSPDGRHIAWYANGGVGVVGIDGRSNRHIIKMDVVGGGTGEAGLTWTADSSAVIVLRHDGDAGNTVKTTAGTLSISGGKFTAFPESVQGGRRYLMTGGNKKIVYLKQVSIYTADLDGGNIRRTPVIGADGTAENPSRIEAIGLGLVNPDGSRVTAQVMRKTDMNGPGDQLPRVLIDTVNGKVVPIDVPGAAAGLVITSDGFTVVRSLTEGEKCYLTLFSPDFQKVDSTMEPAGLPFDVELTDYVG
jgi:hypothetical protein